jgi:hypothetical protein
VTTTRNIKPADWNGEVDDIRRFLDAEYGTGLGGNAQTKKALKYAPNDWARIGLEKFTDRIILQLANADVLVFARFSEAVSQMVNDCVTFGNSTLIIGENSCRVSAPELGKAKQDSFGQTCYVEELPDGTRCASGPDGVLYLLEGDLMMPTTFTTFSIFNKPDYIHPYGRSRITPAIRKLIRRATRNAERAEIVEEFHSFPQRIINGIWQDFSADGSAEAVKKLNAGLTTMIALPNNPITGEKLSISELSQASLEPFSKKHDELARDVASSFNIDPSELSVAQTNPSSADALYAAKEDLVVEISRFETSITPTISKAAQAYANMMGESTPTVSWAEPATPSKNSQADAFVKLASVLPALKTSPAALRWAGLPDELVKELQGEYSQTEQLTNLIPPQLGDMEDSDGE